MGRHADEYSRWHSAKHGRWRYYRQLADDAGCAGAPDWRRHVRRCETCGAFNGGVGATRIPAGDCRRAAYGSGRKNWRRISRSAWRRRRWIGAAIGQRRGCRSARGNRNHAFAGTGAGANQSRKQCEFAEPAMGYSLDIRRSWRWRGRDWRAREKPGATTRGRNDAVRRARGRPGDTGGG